VETYQTKPSPFFKAKAQEDERVVFYHAQRPANIDWTIGLKRNMCTHLASGQFIANFDDDDLYAPNYITTMVQAMIAQGSNAVTLSSWFVYNVATNQFGFVDPEEYSHAGEKDNWLYGYGFSYVYHRKASFDSPYLNCNMSEDYEFFRELRTKCSPRGSKRSVSLYYDKYGIVLHTLHPKATSNSWAKREVPIAEVASLDIVALSKILTYYMNRFPRTGKSSEYIGDIEGRSRQLEVVSKSGSEMVTCLCGVTVSELLQRLVQKLGRSSRELTLFAQDPWTSNGQMRPDVQALGANDHIGMRVERVWVATIELGGSYGGAPGVPGIAEATTSKAQQANVEQDEKEIYVTVTDVRDTSFISQVALPNANVPQQAVIDELVKEAGIDPDEHKKIIKGLRLAVVMKDNSTFVSCDLNERVGHHRMFHARGLYELLEVAQKK